jgi:RNA polymerase sigma-70 factor (ECF subfamily)
MNETASASDAYLVRKAQAGDNQAFGVLVGRYMRAAYAVSLSVTGRHDDAEDAAQEAFMVALARLDDCRTPDRFAGWLLTIVRNRARNLVRREVLRDTDVLPETAAARGRTPEKATEHAELQERLGTALRRLPEVQREIVLLHDLEGWRHREIAEHLGIPSGTVRSHLHFARKSLRQDSDLAQLTAESGQNGHVQSDHVPNVGQVRDYGNMQTAPSIGRTV